MFKIGKNKRLNALFAAAMAAAVAAPFSTAHAETAGTAAQFKDLSDEDKNSVYLTTLRTASIIARANGDSTQAKCVVGFPNRGDAAGRIRTAMNASANKDRHPSYVILNVVRSTCGAFKY